MLAAELKSKGHWRKNFWCRFLLIWKKIFLDILLPGLKRNSTWRNYQICNKLFKLNLSSMSFLIDICLHLLNFSWNVRTANIDIFQSFKFHLFFWIFKQLKNYLTVFVLTVYLFWVNFWGVISWNYILRNWIVPTGALGAFQPSAPHLMKSSQVYSGTI